MKYKKKKIKLTKFGKIFFSLIGIFIISIFMLSINSFKHRFYKVEESDMGRIIGKQGKVANSIRTVMKALGSREKKKVGIEFLDD